VSRLYVVYAVRWTPTHQDTSTTPLPPQFQAGKRSALSAALPIPNLKCHLCDTDTPLQPAGGAGSARATVRAEAVNRLPHLPGDLVAELHLKLPRPLLQIHQDCLRKLMRIRNTYTSIATTTVAATTACYCP